jgi:hypothetical protein
MSGEADYVTGWIANFFPHSNSEEPVDHLEDLKVILENFKKSKAENKKMKGAKFDLMKVPSGMNSAPFDWNYCGTKNKMEFVSGFMGAQKITTEEGEGYMKAKIGWAVCNQVDKKNEY